MQGNLIAGAATAAMALLVAACGTPPMQAGTDDPLTIAAQGSFFVGGRDVKSDTLSTLPAYAPSGTISVDQMYVRYQIPAQDTGRPLTFIHGCCLTGKTWETTPDGRMGWDEFFVRKGHPTYVVDQVARGRSAADPSAIVGAKLGKMPANRLPPVFAAGREGACGRSFASARNIRRSFPACSFPSRRRPSSGSRWWPTGARRCRRRTRP
jgi:hypothetical protein